MRNKRHIERLNAVRKLSKSITRKQYEKHVETVKGQRGYFIKSRRKGEYNIHIRLNDFGFNWLGWDNPHNTLWDVLARYPEKIIEWIYEQTGVDIDRASDKELIELVFSTDAVVIEGEPSDYAIGKMGIIISSFFETLKLASNRIKK